MNNYKKIMLINQPAGLGDIFYLQKAVKYYADQGVKIYWPVQKEFGYLTEYLDYPNINYYPQDKNYPYKNLCEGQYNLFSKQYKTSIMDHENNIQILYTPFTHAHAEFEIFQKVKSTMLVKYSLVDQTHENWQNYFTFKRNPKREEILKNKLNLKKNEEFIFVNDLFASPPNMLKREMNIKSNLKIVYNDGLPCHIFDYCWILENAKEIHTIESSLCYIVEVLNTTDKLFMYSRIINGKQQHKNFDYINGIHTKPWVKIYD
jgi:IS1 family transposase